MSEARPTTDELRTPDSYPLRVGDEVTDLQQVCEVDMEPEPAIVIGLVGDDVYDATFEDISGEERILAEYEPNTRYADFEVSERVVTIAWKSWLDNNVPRWEAHRGDHDDLTEHLATSEESWDIPVSTVGSYDYPESRLRLEHRPFD